MNNLIFSKFHYFFYGACTEDVLSGMLQSAEAKGCEFLQLVPMQVPIAPQGLVKANGRPEIVLLYRLFVRCLKADFERIKKEMEEDAKREQMEGLRLGAKQ